MRAYIHEVGVLHTPAYFHIPAHHWPVADWRIEKGAATTRPTDGQIGALTQVPSDTCGKRGSIAAAHREEPWPARDIIDGEATACAVAE